MKLGPRKGDNAPIVIMELVTEPVKAKAKKAAPAAKVTKVEEAPVEEAEETVEEAPEAAEEAPADEEKAE